MSRSVERGQASVELALVLPVVAVVLLVVLQIASVVRDSIAVAGAARAGARRVMVVPEVGAAVDAAARETSLDRSRLEAHISGSHEPGGLAAVTITYRSPTNVPLVGRFVGDVDLTERLVVMIE